MFKSVFTRLLVAYLVIILGSLILFGVGSAELFRVQFMDERIEEMTREAQMINQIMEFDFPTSPNAVKKELRIIARKYNASIWVLDIYNHFLLESDPEHQSDWAGQESVPIPSDIEEKVLSGMIVSTTGFFGDLFSEPIMTIGYPLSVDRHVTGAIFMHVRSTDVERQVGQIYRNVGVASLIAIVFVSLLIYYTSSRISKPLVEMNLIAQRFSKGDFTVRPKISGRDEIAQLANSIDRMADDLNDQEAMRRSFVANVSHELKSPLAAMRGFLESLLDGTTGEADRRQTLEIVLDETKRLNLLINDLLDLARIESGKFPISPSVFDINESIRRTLILFESRINEKKLDVFVRFRQDYCYVMADKDRIEQVLRNLMDNAIKFSKSGGALSVSTHAMRGLAAITVADTGVGIPDEDIRHIWERFYKVDKAHTHGDSGTGLGLSIIKRIIDEHQQVIRVKSAKGKGTIFTFTLELAKEQPLRRRIGQ